MAKRYDRRTDQRRVLIPVDGSKNSERAFQWYYEFFNQENDYVIIVHADEGNVVPTSEAPYTMDYPQEAWDELKEKEAVKIESLLDKYKDLCNQCNLDFETVAIRIENSESPADAIRKAAGPDERNAHVILIGSRGLNTIQRKFLGSVSEQLLTEANLPVIVVPPS